MKKYVRSVFMILAATLVLLALSGCDQSGDDGADPPPSSGRYESVEDLANLAGIETGGTYTVILGSSINISESWGAINDAIYVAKKYLTLDLRACASGEMVEGAELPSGNDFNIIRYNPYITGITLPQSVQYIDQTAFMGCLSLSSVILPDGLLGIGLGAFNGCTGLSSISIPDSVATIGVAAFLGCTGLTGITLPSGLATIGQNTFLDCTGLTGITIPAAVTDIALNAFNGCTSLTTVVFEGGATTIVNNKCFPHGSSLRTAYAGGGAGTYTRDGTVWSKES
jgi:hypothetical protein